MNTLLLIEDDPSFVDLVDYFINKSTLLQLSLVHVSSLGEAKAYLADPKEGLDIVLMDLNLKDSDAHQTLNTFFSSTHGFPVIVMTSLDIRMGLKAIELGADDYLNKDTVDAEQFEKTVLLSLSRYKQRDRGGENLLLDPFTNYYTATALDQIIDNYLKTTQGKYPCLKVSLASVFFTTDYALHNHRAKQFSKQLVRDFEVMYLSGFVAIGIDDIQTIYVFVKRDQPIDLAEEHMQLDARMQYFENIYTDITWSINLIDATY